MKSLFLSIFFLSLSSNLAMSQGTEGAETLCNEGREKGKEVLECPAGYKEIEGGKCQKGNEIVEKVVKGQ